MPEYDAKLGRTFFTWCALVFSCWTVQLASKNITDKVSTENSYAVVELAIYYDDDTFKHFNESLYTLTNYWKSSVWDLHLKFQSVPNINISFRLNSIAGIGPEGQRNLIEPSLLPDGSLSINLLQKYWNKFYNNTPEAKLMEYDIAVLVVSKTLDGDTTVAYGYQGGTCNVYDDNEQFVDTSLAIITMHEERFGNKLTSLIAYLLSASSETKENYEKFGCDKFSAAQQHTIMAYGEQKVPKHFFSKCAEKTIKRFIDLDTTTCLKEINTSTAPVLDTSRKCSVVQNVKPITLIEQCRRLIVSKSQQNATVKIQKQNECENTECHINSRFCTMQPMAGSECYKGRDKGTCYVGQCIPNGGYLLNMGSNLCLENTKPFSWTNETGVYNCLDGRSSTPLHYVKLEVAGSTGVYIKFLRFNNKSYSLEEKCLSLDSHSGDPYFEKCDLNAASHIWEQHYSQDNFLLKHLLTGGCLVVTSSTGIAHIATNISCSYVDDKQMWRFVKEDEVLKLLGCPLRETSIETKYSSSNESEKLKISRVAIVAMLVIHYLTSRNW